ncbi:hypothetical protein [Weissella sp. MSCH1]|uniref:rolling circle replication-associated protein n=1 Tax=Weissella sp. MSCH1 TaxID=3383343 RepID=UPI003896AAE1
MSKINHSRKPLILGQPVIARKYGQNVVLQTDLKRGRPEHISHVKTADVRGQNTTSLKRTMTQIRELIAANFDGKLGKGGVFITLTFSDDTIGGNAKSASYESEKFVKRLKRWLAREFPKKSVVYLSVIEPQPKRSDNVGMLIWHFHILMKFEDNSPFRIEKQFLQEKLWKQGVVWITSLSSYKSVSGYVATYLTDLSLETSNNKARIKGEKLRLYPAGLRIYRGSQNLKRPLVERFETKADALEAFGLSDGTSNFVSTFEWSHEETGFQFTSEYYQLQYNEECKDE